MKILKIIISNVAAGPKTCYVFTDTNPTGFIGQPTYWIPLLQQQAPASFWAHPVIYNNTTSIQFDTNAPNVLISTTIDGNDVPNAGAVIWEYVYETHDGVDGTPLPRLFNDNQALHGYDNGNSGANLFFIRPSNIDGSAEIINYSVVIPRRQLTFAADYNIAYKGACSGGSLVSAIADPDNPAQWLVTVNFHEVAINPTYYFDTIPPNQSELAATNYLYPVFLQFTTVVAPPVILQNIALFANQTLLDPATTLELFTSGNNLATTTPGFSVENDTSINNESAAGNTPFSVTFTVAKTLATFADDYTIMQTDSTSDAPIAVAAGGNWNVTLNNIVINSDKLAQIIIKANA